MNLQVVGAPSSACVRIARLPEQRGKMARCSLQESLQDLQDCLWCLLAADHCPFHQHRLTGASQGRQIIRASERGKVGEPCALSVYEVRSMSLFLIMAFFALPMCLCPSRAPAPFRSHNILSFFYFVQGHSRSKETFPLSCSAHSSSVPLLAVVFTKNESILLRPYCLSQRSFQYGIFFDAFAFKQ